MEGERIPADTYRAVASRGRTELKVKGSRFIAEAFPVGSDEAAVEQLSEIRRREHAATHHCSAYRLGEDGATFRYDDDGEPSGTAGAPILRQIDGRGLTNTLVVVTRYYGGTKLGTGGLSRAYGDAAAAVLETSSVQEHVINERVKVSFSYEDTSPAMHTVHQFAGNVLESRYSDRTELTVAVRRGEAHAFVEAFVNALGGRAEVERLED